MPAAAPIAEPVRPRRRWVTVLIAAASVVYLLAVLAIWGLLRLAGETFWLATALLYLPRWPWALPAIPIGIAAWLRWRPGALLAAIGAIVILVPVCGLRVGGSPNVPAGATPIRVATLNIQNGRPNLLASLGEVERFEPDILCCQEVDFEQLDLLATAETLGLDHVRHDSTMWTASRWPLRLVRVVESQASYRDICAIYEVRRPEKQPLSLVNVHLTTARYGLTKLKVHTPLTGAGLKRLSENQSIRLTEIDELTEVLDSLDGSVIACGDFNMPSDSPAMQTLLARRRRVAFDAVGTGYGYTVPNDVSRFWPRGLCWLRVDHVVTSGRVVPLDAAPGAASGSDHRAMLAVLAIRDSASR